MLGFLGLGGSGDGEDPKQTASLVDHDVMEKKKKKGKKKETKTVAEASKAADAALQATQQMTDAMEFWTDDNLKKAKPRKKKPKPSSDNISVVSGISQISGISGLSLNLGLDEIEEFKPVAEFEQGAGTGAGAGLRSDIDVLEKLKKAEKKIEKEKKNKKKHETSVSYKGITAKTTEKRTKQIKDTLDWWTDTFVDQDERIQMGEDELKKNAVEDIQDVLQWWNEEGDDYNGPKKTQKRAMVVRDVLSQVDKKKTITLEQKAEEMKAIMGWWKEAGVDYKQDLAELDKKVSDITQVKQLFDRWEQKQLPPSKRTVFDPIYDPGRAQEMAKEIKKEMTALSKLDQSRIEGEGVDFAIDPFKNIKYAMTNWNYESSLEAAAKHFEKVLDWWAKNGASYNPVEASQE